MNFYKTSFSSFQLLSFQLHKNGDLLKVKAVSKYVAFKKNLFSFSDPGEPNQCGSYTDYVTLYCDMVQR
jgi:hypothetical protein